MAYSPQTWVDAPSQSSPMTAARLNYMETGINNASITINALDYLVVGDGVTDNTTALTNWITAINTAAKGSFAFLPPGQYNILSALPAITAHGVTIMGAGWAQTNFTKGSVISAGSGYTDSGAMLSISGEGCSLQQITIDGANRSTLLTAITGANGKFLNMSWHGSKANGVCLDIQSGAISTWVGNCRINGINYPNTGIQVNDTDCIIYASKPTNNTYNIVLLGGASGSMIVDNHMTPGAGGANCIWINGNPSHVQIDSNRFDNYVQSGVQITPPASTPNSISITNNHFHSTVQTDNTYALIGLDTTSSGVRALHIVGNSGYGSATNRPKWGVAAQKQDGTTPTNTSRLNTLGSVVRQNTFWCATGLFGNSTPSFASGNMISTDGTTWTEAASIAPTPSSLTVTAAGSSIAGDFSNSGTGTVLNALASDTVTGAQAAFFKTFAGSGTAHVHALTAYTTGDGNAFSSAANLVSDNSAASCVQVTGTESGRGSIKTAHLNPGPAASSDANASALSIDLQWGSQSGTAAQGIFIDATTGGTTGKLINVRNSGNTIFNIVPKSSDFTTALETHNTQARFSDGVATKTNAGTISDGTFSNGAADGLHAYDSTNGNHAVRLSGNWYVNPVGGSPNTQPADHSYITWTADPGIRVGSAAPTAGVLNIGKVMIRYPVTVATLSLHVSTAGSGVQALVNCYVGLYNSSGTQVGFNASDQASNWASTGIKAIALTASSAGSLNLTPGFYWTGILVGTQSTTAVALSHTGASASFTNAGLTASTFRTGTNGSSLSALPSPSITPSSNTNTSFNGFWWTALS